jgi:hypothetical protein
MIFMDRVMTMHHVFANEVPKLYIYRDAILRIQNKNVFSSCFD